ncbi:ABC transporter substrate-binding protein [Devosia sp. RR2S18]|uniref:ABC transporter substrate-binding protein n=1 Tax=Devosia rhizosphaerae TaxID=3049774 RepID=UPI002540F01D|nr:ABC transporter substrate-binding protein [Devosia sp. RR2S18]WIJ24949.1 ABC transporter substrate-binding protein [Devosia sp. RR2S18]
MKRTVTAVLAGLVATAALSASALALDCAEGQRPIIHAAGETCIPEQPERIVAPRGDSIATPLIDLGAPLVGAGFQSGEDGQVFLRGASDIFGASFVDELGLATVGNPNEPDIEAIAALEPDLIILTDYQQSIFDQAARIAPTIVVEGNLPFLEHLAFLADAAGMQGEYESRLAAYRAKIEDLQATLGDASAITVSRLDLWEDGLWYYPNWGAIDQVINDVGFSRPPIQAEATENISALSFERLPEFDADVILSSRAPRFGQTIAMLEEQWDAAAPFWRQLPGVTAGNHYWYERDVWVGYTFKSLEAAADGLLLLTAGRFDGAE